MNEWVAVNKNYGYYPTLPLSSVSQVSAHLSAHTSASAHAHSHVNHRIYNTHTLSSTQCSSSSSCMSPTATNKDMDIEHNNTKKTDGNIYFIVQIL